MLIDGYRVTQPARYCELCGRRVWPSQQEETGPMRVAHSACVAYEQAKRKHGIGTRPKPPTR